MSYLARVKSKLARRPRSHPNADELSELSEETQLPHVVATSNAQKEPHELWEGPLRGAVVSVESFILGERVQVVRDAVKKAQIEAMWPGVAVYTRNEVHELFRNGCEPDRLRAINEAKRIFPGAMISPETQVEVIQPVTVQRSTREGKL